MLTLLQRGVRLHAGVRPASTAVREEFNERGYVVLKGALAVPPQKLQQFAEEARGRSPRAHGLP